MACPDTFTWVCSIYAVPPEDNNDSCGYPLAAPAPVASACPPDCVGFDPSLGYHLGSKVIPRLSNLQWKLQREVTQLGDYFRQRSLVGTRVLDSNTRMDQTQCETVQCFSSHAIDCMVSAAVARRGLGDYT